MRISTIAHFLSRAARLEQVRGSISIPTFSRTTPSKLKTVSAVIRGVVGMSGQSLPILGPLPTIDVLWSDLHMVHKDRSLMSYESFYWTFRTA
jgi:hypothetical protein